MGFLKDLVGVAAPIAGAVFGGVPGALVGGLVGGLAGGSGPKSQTVTQQQQLDPRVQSLLFGGNGNQGVLDKFRGYLNEPGSDAQRFLGELGGNYILGSAGEEFQRIRNANYDLLRGNQAPTVSASQISSPSQNSLNLSPAYQQFIYGNDAENPYLNRALQSGINQSTQAFQTQLGDITNNLQRSILPGIRGSAIASGQFGSSRQGIAEGLALSDLNRQATNAAQQLGLANISATTGAQANAFSQGRDRSLNALNTLSGQQYNTALNQAQLNQQANLANAQSTLTNQAQNNAANIAGQQGIMNLLNTANQANQNAYNYGINRAQQVSGLLSPFIGVNQSSTSTQPLYNNRAANALGTAGAALGLYNQFGGLFGGNSGSGGASIGSSLAGAFSGGY